MFSLLGYLGGVSWIFDLFSHFKAQYLLILLFGGGMIFISNKKLGLLFMLFIVLLFIEVVPIYFGGQKNVDLTNSTKIICINLLSSNTEYKEVARFITSEAPDVLVLQEITSRWEAMLEPSLKDYTSRLVVPREDNFGIAVYSKVNISNLKELQFGDSRSPSIRADLFLHDRKVSLLAAHTMPPIGYANSEIRNHQLSELSTLVSGLENEVVLIGDLNISSFSSHFKKLINSSNLVDSRKGFGLLPTWPTWFYPMQTTLDHCLVSEGIQVKSRKVGRNMGSDHLPIIVEFGME